MTKKIAILILCLVILPQISWAAPCSRINLTRCLDSACAINLSSNAAARCQYCGTPDAGLPPTTLRSVTAGTSSKNTISAKELRQAPNDPGERYVWATRLCLDKIPNCTAEDVSEAYDDLIEKSCRAAGIKNDMASLQKKSAQNTKNSRTCLNEISKCVTASGKCDTNFSKCVDDKIFNNFFATCSSQSTGCTNYIDTVRTEVNKSRQSIISATESNINAIANARKLARINRFAIANFDCLHDIEYNKCIDNACQNNTNDNCETNQDIAIALCEFYKTACTKIDVLTEQQLQKKLDELIEK